MAFNPFYQQNPYMYQPQYLGYQQQMQPQMPQQYQQSTQPVQQTQIPVSNQNTPQTIPGQMVDSLDAARAKDIDMSGAPRYYPNINGQEIYMKQLQADGTCPTVVYKRVVTELPLQVSQPTDMYAEAFGNVLAELDAIKAMILEPSKRTIKSDGGAKA